jgi:ubiquinone/menaquinone biosynthesis C-methylase UbiE
MKPGDPGREESSWSTDYLGIHDSGYRRLKEQGEEGWSEARDIERVISQAGEALARLGRGTTGRMLEMGCGDGRIALGLARKGFEVSGIDISPTAVEWAKEKARELDIDADFREGLVTDLPFGDGSFDLVVDGHCLHCVIGGDRGTFLSEALRVLVPGGLLLVVTMCNDPTDETMRRYFDPVSRNVIRDGVAGRYFGLPESILDEVRGAGFRVVNWFVDPADEADRQDDIVIEAVKPEGMDLQN